MAEERAVKRAEPKVLADARQAYDCALNLLSYRDFSERELRERLCQRGATVQVAEEAIAKLRHYGLLDEERYAWRVYEAWLRKGCYGRLHLTAELKKHGVPVELVRQILSEFTEEQEAAHAERAAELFLQRNRKRLTGAVEQDKKIYGAACRFLATRGFSAGYMSVLWEKLRLNHDI